VALVVETPDLERIPFDRARDLQEALDDAVDLGATTMRVTAKDPVDGIVEAARAHGARTIVLPHAGDAGLRRLMARPLADRLLERLPDADLHLVGPAAAP
jgi:two-component system sensor histidine kinase KdpD